MSSLYSKPDLLVVISWPQFYRIVIRLEAIVTFYCEHDSGMVILGHLISYQTENDVINQRGIYRFAIYRFFPRTHTSIATVSVGTS